MKKYYPCGTYLIVMLAITHLCVIALSAMITTMQVFHLITSPTSLTDVIATLSAVISLLTSLISYIAISNPLDTHGKNNQLSQNYHPYSTKLESDDPSSSDMEFHNDSERPEIGYTNDKTTDLD